MIYRPTWDLTTIPPDRWASEHGRRMAAKRYADGRGGAGGRPPTPKPCPVCGAICIGARAAKEHCKGKLP